MISMFCNRLLVGGVAIAAAGPASAAAPATASPPTATEPKASAKPTPKPTGTRAARARSSYLVGAKIFTVDAGIIENGVIEISGGTITRVGGPELRTAIPAEATIVDITGKIVTPGLIAADTSLGLTEIGAEPSTNDNSRDDEETIRAGYDPSPAITAFSSLIPVQAIDGVTSAAVAPSGGLLSGQVSWIDLVYADQNGIVVETNIAVDGRIGQAYAGSRAATLAKLRQVLDDAQFYRRNKAAFDRGQSRKLSAAPHDLAALDDVLAGREPLTISADRASDILALLDIARDYRIKVVIVGGAQAWQVASELASTRTPVVVKPSSNLPGSFARLGARLDNAALLAAAGVPVIIGDPGAAHNARNLTHEGGIAIANGLSFEHALAGITLNVARAYGMEKRYGSITAGKVANLVVWDADPFELGNWPSQVWIHGRAIPMTSRQTLLRDRYLERLGLR